MDAVVSEDTPCAPGLSAVYAIVEGAGPSVITFQARDPGFDTGAPFHDTTETALLLHATSIFAGFAFARNDDAFDAEVLQFGVDARFAVSAVPYLT